MIHLACYCGAQLIYLGEESDNLAQSDIIAKTTSEVESRPEVWLRQV